METPSGTPPPTAWQPVTPGGVAAFAQASLSRLLLFQLLFAGLSAGALVWLLNASVFPNVRTAIRNLPETGAIQNGELFWNGPTPTLLADGRVLSIVVDLQHTGRTRVPSDLCIELGTHSWRALSLAGYMEFPYQAGTVMAFNRPELEPWWGAWAAPLLAIAFLATTAALVSLWALVAALYCPVAWVIGFFADKTAGPGMAWRLCGAAMMPASLLLVSGFVLYAGAALNLIGLLFMIAAHLLCSWIYIVVSAFKLPANPNVKPSRKNPFAASNPPASNHGTDTPKERSE